MHEAFGGKLRSAVVTSILLAIAGLFLVLPTLTAQKTANRTGRHSMSPANATVALGATQQFTASGATSWSATAGTISSTGLYMAPAKMPSSPTVTVTATGSGFSANATVTLTAPIAQTISPTTVSLALGGTQQFTSAGATSWTATAGTITTSGFFTAPATMPSSGSVTITATGPSGSASAVAKLFAKAGTITPSVSTLSLGKSQQFSYSGATNWQATVGSITTAGLYTAPATMPSSANVTITAADASTGVYANTTVTLVGSSSPTISPATVSLATGQTQQFTSAGATSWSATAGSVSSSGLYTAPATIPSSPTVTVTATSSSGSVSATVTLTSTTAGSFTLNGLTSPATVAETIFVNGSSVASGATVYYYIDSTLVDTETSTPYWLGGGSASSPTGYSTNSLSAGIHTLTATAVTSAGSSNSNSITLNVVPSINGQFSTVLAKYANQISAQQQTPATILKNTSTSGASVTTAEMAVRQSVVQMYANWGIDISLDRANDQSSVLQSLEPATWQAPASTTPSAPFSMAFSPDAPYYHAIPASWPKVALPAGYVSVIQLNTNQGGSSGNGDGIGFGETVATSTSPMLTVTSEWPGSTSTLVTYPFRMPTNWSSVIPSNSGGDRHVIFIDPFTDTFASSYITSLNQSTGGPNGDYITNPVSFNSLGGSGGSIASHSAELPAMIQPGEATNATTPIPHALMGPVGRPYAARVFPAIAWDSGILTQSNVCGGSGPENTGLVPYGGVIQLDPALNLSTLKLSLPALRILQAMQTYGYYVVDTGCQEDIDFYTAIPETELDPFGGSYGNSYGPGVQNELQTVLSTNTLYVVAPLTKKQ